MNLRRTAAAAGALVLLASLGACGKSGNPGQASCDDTLSFQAAKNASVENSPTFDTISKRGHPVVGVKADQPNLGYKDAQGHRCGFDIAYARMVSAKLGFDPAKITFKEIPSQNRETELKGGGVDYYVGTYSITDERKRFVDFAGPYYIAGQDLLVRSDDNSITGPKSLKGKKVCSATGSTSVQRIRDQKLTQGNNISEFKEYSQCVSQLLDGKVDVVTTDDAILKGYAANDPEELKVVGKPFSQEKYGVGLHKGDKAMRDAVNDIIAKSAKDGDWKKIYDATLGKSGSSAKPPKLERY